MATTVTKYSQGPPTRHILASQGPSAHPLNFYSTTYSVNHGRHPTYPQSKSIPKGTGYIANFRPAIYYNSRIDLTDNPTIIKLIRSNYNTQSSLDFPTYRKNTGYEQLPSSLRHCPTGFTNNHPRTCATSDHALSSNTSYRHGYPTKKFRDGSISPSTHSRKEYSGFSHSVNREPITYRPNESYSGDIPGNITWRPTGHSIMKHDYYHTSPLTGRESLPFLSAGSDRSNGYIKGNNYPTPAQPVDTKNLSIDQLNQMVAEAKCKQDPAVFSVWTNPHQYTAYSKVIYTPQAIHPCKVGNKETGKKELSGYSDNTKSHVRDTTPFHQTTSSEDNYQHPPFHDRPPITTERETTVNGYTKSTQVHKRSEYNPIQILRNNNAYVAKSILSKDPCFVDMTYQNKMRSSK